MAATARNANNITFMSPPRGTNRRDLPDCVRLPQYRGKTRQTSNTNAGQGPTPLQVYKKTDAAPQVRQLSASCGLILMPKVTWVGQSLRPSNMAEGRESAGFSLTRQPLRQKTGQIRPGVFKKTLQRALGPCRITPARRKPRNRGFGQWRFGGFRPTKRRAPPKHRTAHCLLLR